VIEYIAYKEKNYAIIIRNNFNEDGAHFFTDKEMSQQLGYMKYKKGKLIQPHIHKSIERKIYFTQEVLLLKKGKLKVDFYDEKQKYFLSKILFSGDVILLASGGHGFEVLEDIEMIEVKQGPYLEEDDKIRFKS
tara:strand:- start:1330 stop:1731 length:402 start_codon:yes stop_codon:yes gene_type:complete